MAAPSAEVVEIRQAAQAGVLRVRDIEVVGAEGALAARVYAGGAPGVKQDSLIVYFHGGGFVAGDVEDSDAFLRALVLEHPQQVVLATNYTLATVRPFPAAIEDAHAVLLWAKKHKAKLGWNGKQMLVAGIEAGANLAAVCALMARDRGGPPLAGQILIMPMLDPGLSSGSMRELPNCPEMARVAQTCETGYRNYLPNAADRSHPYASPLQSSRLKNLPPALILSCQDDPLRDEAEQYGAKLIGCGIKTTVSRMAAVPLSEAGARDQYACHGNSLREIAAFIASLHGSPTEPPA
jgi:acetyl esterase/lipase